MARCITRNDVAEVGSMKLEDLTNVKGAHLVTEAIKEGLRRGARIACIGGQGTGKSLAMRVILAEAVYFEEDTTIDGPKEERDFKAANSNRIRYVVMEANSAEEFMEKLKENSKKDLVVDTLVITRGMDKEHGRFISSVDEITSYDGENVINNIVSIHKDRYVKNNNITIETK